MRIKLRQIMSATDISQFSNHTLSFGVGMAREFNARLYACHVINMPSVATYYGSAHIDPETERVRLESYVHDQFHRLLGDQPVQWEALISIGHPADEIARLAAEKDVDLVISATHGRSGLKRLILGSVTERLMRTLPCPLLIIRGPAQTSELKPDKMLTFDKVMVGCDFSEDSQAAVDYGLSLAQEFESELHLIHVIEPPVYLDLDHAAIDVGMADPQAFEDRLGQKLRSLVPSAAADWCAPRFIIRNGQSYDELTRYAQDIGVNLIVLGARGYSLVEKLFVGSTTDRVARRAPCPVLSVRTKPESAQSG